MVGAVGVYCVGVPGAEVGIALKVEDGAKRPAPALLAAVLRRWGAHGEAIDRWAEQPVLGGGKPVGAVRVVGI
jgi:L-asparaginase II